MAPKVMDVLCVLVSRRGGIVSKTELMESVWADSFVEESNLTQSIYTLRRTLGKDQADKDLIETVPRRGYRMAVNIRSSDGQADLAPTASWSGKFAFPLALGIAAFVVLCVLGTYLYSSRSATLAPIEKVKLQRLTFSGDIGFPVISPNGQSFTYVKENTIIIWTPDGRFFDYVENLPAGAKFWRQDANGSAQRKLLFELSKDRIFSFAWSADGNTLALSRGRQENDAVLLKGFE